MPAQEIARRALDSISETRLRTLEHSNLRQTTAVLRERLHRTNLRISRLYNHHEQGDRLNEAYTVALLDARHIAAILEYRHRLGQQQCDRQKVLDESRNTLGFRNPRRG